MIAVIGLTLFLSVLRLHSLANAQEFVTLATRANVTLSYLIAALPKAPQATALLFAGSGGFIQLRKEQDQIKFKSDNFLVRSRDQFSARGVIAAVVDAPSDQQSGWGMSDEFRKGRDHLTDIVVVIDDLGKRFPAIPLFLVGTSRGSVSAAFLGAKLGQRAAGVVLTASMFRRTGRQSKEPGLGLSDFDFATIKTPLLFVHHADDQCAVTPYGEAARLADKYPLISVFGGSPPQSGPCEPFSQHGFFGKEAETVEQMVNWMVKKPFISEVR